MASWFAFEQLTSDSRPTGVALRRLTRRLAGLRPGVSSHVGGVLAAPVHLHGELTGRRPKTGREPVDMRRARCHNYPPNERWNQLSISDLRLSRDFNPVDYMVVSRWPPCRYSVNPAGRHLEFVNVFRYLREQPAAYGLRWDISGAVQRPQRRTGGHQGLTSRDRCERTSRFAYS
jgi:hypothetical protein